MVTVAMALAAAGMLLTMHRILIRDAESAGATRAHQLAEALEADGLNAMTPMMLARAPTSPTWSSSMPPARFRSPAWWGPAAAGEPAARTYQGRPQYRGDRPVRLPVHRQRGGGADPDGPLTVLRPPTRADNHLGPHGRYTICLVFPGIIIGVALLTYFLVGRALRPVESIRRQADAISGGDTSRRLTVPDTGDEIAELAGTMNAMLERIEHSRARQLQFVNDASHELNSPLTTLVGLLDLSRATGQPIDVDTVETIMLPDAQRLGRLVEDMLTLARADEHGMRARTQPVDLDDLVRAEVARMRALSPAAVSSAIVAARVDGDPGTLTRAIRNIADNAARHTRNQLSFSMSRDEHRHRVTVTVADDGPGIADADKARVFDRFVRLDDSRDRGQGGSGLGLAIVTEIVRAHGGTVSVADNPGDGAAFTITLPLAPQTPDDDGRAEPNPRTGIPCPEIP